MDCAIEALNNLSLDIDGYKRDAASGKLVMEMGETLPTYAMELGSAAKAVGSAMAQLLAAADQGNAAYTGKAARETSNAVKQLTHVVYGVAAGMTDRNDQQEILDAGKHVVAESESLLREVKGIVEVPHQPNKKAKLSQSAKAVSQALNELVDCLPAQKEIAAAIRTVANAVKEAEGIKPPKGQSYQSLQNSLSVAASDLNQLANEMYTVGKTNPDQLPQAATAYAQKFKEMVNAGA